MPLYGARRGHIRTFWTSEYFGYPFQEFTLQTWKRCARVTKPSFPDTHECPYMPREGVIYAFFRPRSTFGTRDEILPFKRARVKSANWWGMRTACGRPLSEEESRGKPLNNPRRHYVPEATPFLASAHSLLRHS